MNCVSRELPILQMSWNLTGLAAEGHDSVKMWTRSYSWIDTNTYMEELTDLPDQDIFKLGGLLIIYGCSSLYESLV